ncbi:MAG: response regulator [Aulosira sp. DedQUE10]|nr:response regulator [Aulosira sp. DedQUE10]
MAILSNVLNEFKNCTQLQYNGNLTFKSPKEHKWTFYYRMGTIVWASGGIHPFRRWRRQMAQNCPQIDVDKMRFRPEDLSIEYWDYRLLEILYKKQKIQREKIQNIVNNTIIELLFDLAQEFNLTSLSCNRNQEFLLELPISYTSADISLKQIEDSWKIWSLAGLTKLSPDLAPIIRKPEQLQHLVNSHIYHNFVNSINGKDTLRDLSVKMNQSTLLVARSLLPYILKGIIELLEVPDLPLAVIEPQKNSTAIAPNNATAPLVACIDDSPQVCKILEEIMTSDGLRFVKIQDAVQALPILIKDKPDLIFLDLIMPIVNGYEICIQLRRTSAFANTPIIILTGNDGILDRVRAKVVGSTDFLTKPVVADKVISMMRKYLPMHTSSSSIKPLQLESL